jgi:ABC-type dipeptide/oligopeptide/nickel transport system permease subunit
LGRQVSILRGRRLTTARARPIVIGHSHGIFVVLAVLMFSFVGDGLRDAADPYQ